MAAKIVNSPNIDPPPLTTIQANSCRPSVPNCITYNSLAILISLSHLFPKMTASSSTVQPRALGSRVRDLKNLVLARTRNRSRYSMRPRRQAKCKAFKPSGSNSSKAAFNRFLKPEDTFPIIVDSVSHYSPPPPETTAPIMEYLR